MTDSPPPSWYEPPDDGVDGFDCHYGAHLYSACPPCCRGVEMEQAEEAADAEPAGPPRCVDCNDPLADQDSGGLCVGCALKMSLQGRGEGDGTSVPAGSDGPTPHEGPLAPSVEACACGAPVDDVCPLCKRGFCQTCAERPYELCCDIGF